MNAVKDCEVGVGRTVMQREAEGECRGTDCDEDGDGGGCFGEKVDIAGAVSSSWPQPIVTHEHPSLHQDVMSDSATKTWRVSVQTREALANLAELDTLTIQALNNAPPPKHLSALGNPLRPR